MLRMSIRQLCGRTVQLRTFSVKHSLGAKSQHEEKLNGSGASSPKSTQSSKEAVDDIVRRSSKPVETAQNVRPSVAQRLFMNEVDEECLIFPEIAEKENLDKIYEANASKAPFFHQHLSIVDKNTAVFKHLKEFDAFKHNIQSEYGGLAYSLTESALASEPEGHNVSVALALSAHRNVCSAISAFGSIHQKEKYLPLLASGEMIGTICVSENQTDDQFVQFVTKAELIEDADVYILNGYKAFVVNSVNSQLYLVFAQTRTADMLGDMNDSISAFLVEANAPGVTVSQRDETIGCQHVYQSTVTFDNVRVKSENCLSIPGSGQSILQKYVTEKRLQHGLINIAQMRGILGQLVQHCQDIEGRNTWRQIEDTASTGAISLRDVIARTANAIYAAESTVYLTAGIADTFDNADIFTEATIAKVYTQERLFEIMSWACSYMENNVTVKGHPMEEKIRDVIQLQTIDDPKESLKLFVGIAGIQYCGQRMFEDIKKKRNPLLNPEFIMNLIMKQGSTIDKVELKLNIKKHLHPALDKPIKWFEESVGRLNLGTNLLMTEYAKELPQEHCKILRLADAGILNYVMMATLARVSRAVCHKFQTATAEQYIAGLVCEEHRTTILRLMKELDSGPQNSFDPYYQKVSKMLLKEKKYFTEHPLTRFF